MGTDKALLVVDGRPLAVRIADALWEAGCHPVWCQGGDLDAFRDLGLDAIADALPGEGPLAAIATALEVAAGHDVVVAACDLVGLDAPTVTSLLGRRSPAADVVIAHADGRDHLLGVWSPAAREPVGGLVRRGVRSLHEAFESLSVTRVAVDPDRVRNANLPGDLGDGIPGGEADDGGAGGGLPRR